MQSSISFTVDSSASLSFGLFVSHAMMSTLPAPTPVYPVIVCSFGSLFSVAIPWPLVVPVPRSLYLYVGIFLSPFFYCCFLLFVCFYQKYTKWKTV